MQQETAKERISIEAILSICEAFEAMVEEISKDVAATLSQDLKDNPQVPDRVRDFVDNTIVATVELQKSVLLRALKELKEKMVSKVKYTGETEWKH